MYDLRLLIGCVEAETFFSFEFFDSNNFRGYTIASAIFSWLISTAKQKENCTKIRGMN